MSSHDITIKTQTINKCPGAIRIGSKIIKPCTHWWKNGTCPYGDNCHYAHQPICTKYPQCPHKICIFRHVDGIVPGIAPGIVPQIVPGRGFDGFPTTSDYTEDHFMIKGSEEFREGSERAKRQAKFHLEIGRHDVAEGITETDRINRLERILLEKIEELKEKNELIKQLTTTIEQLNDDLDDCCANEHMMRAELDQEKKKSRYLNKAEIAEQQILGYL